MTKIVLDKLILPNPTVGSLGSTGKRVRVTSSTCQLETAPRMENSQFIPMRSSTPIMEDTEFIS